MTHNKVNFNKIKTGITEDNKSLLIKAGLIVLLLLFLFMVYGRENSRNIDLMKFRDSLARSCDMGVLQECSSRELMKYMSVNSEDYNQVIYFKSKEALGVEELLIIKSDDRNALAAAKDACEDRITSQIKLYESYGPEQVKLLKNATLFTKGEYLFYSVGDGSDSYEEVFRDAVQ